MIRITKKFEEYVIKASGFEIGLTNFEDYKEFMQNE